MHETRRRPRRRPAIEAPVLPDHSGGTLFWLAGTIVFCVGSGMVPLLNAELLLLAAAAVAPRELRLPLVLVATLGHMAGKAVTFSIGRSAAGLRSERARARIAPIRDRIQRRPASADALLFASAVTGLPPFYVITIACGAVGQRLPRFLLVGGAGRLLRFAAIVFAPELLGIAR